MEVSIAPSSSLPRTQIFSFQNPKQTKPTYNSTRNYISRLQFLHKVQSLKSSEPAGPLLDDIPTSDTFAWNHLIQTHLTNGDSKLAFLTYHQMLLRGVRPDKYTFPRILTASRLLGSLFYGLQVHAQVLKLGLFSDKYVISALIRMYGYLDSADTAKLVFDKCEYPLKSNSVSLTLLAEMYMVEGKPGLGLKVFDQMVENGVEIDKVAFSTAIRACGLLHSLQEGRRVHEIAAKCGLEFDILVSNSLLRMYLDCGSVEDARAVFNRMVSRDTISWTTMLRGYVKEGGFNEGLKLFRNMVMLEGIKPDSLALSSILPACARMAAHKNGKEIHAYLLRNGTELNIAVHNALIDMYVKSGFIESACKIFSRLEKKDVVSWTIMILGYSLHGQGELGVCLFREIERSMIAEIDQTAYAAALHACTTSRMVEEGKYYFNCIQKPEVAHCALLVLLLARAGLFDDAWKFIEERNIERSAEVQRAVLAGCRTHNNSNMGKRIIERLCDLESLNADNYVLLSNWYAERGKWDMVDKLKETIQDMGLRPKKAYSWIELHNKVHAFGTGDVSHPRSVGIYWELQHLMKEMEDKRCFPSSDFSFHDIDEERECTPIGHSELLAISFGLLSTQPGTTIRVTKNLGVCLRCHDIAKFISKMVEREIIIKDSHCFHHFKDGICSCLE
ncbi:Pentatricopeptide repeat [Dillenia turbinata]|uniref:Pentatricopeptide repeat n=1 Tax=Dillenia turbinata TaxID=194707 RepID=A0AAN8Z4T4_9MAGN